MRESLYEAGTTLPDTFTAITPDPVSLALVAIGVLALGMAIGAFLVSSETAAAFALLAAATAGWFLFPYAEVPWATVLAGGEGRTVSAPASTWWIGGSMVALATLELLFSAREALLDQLRANRLPAGPNSATHAATRAATLKLALGSLAGAGLIVVAFAAVRDALGSVLITDPDLLYVPLALGVIAAAALWWLGREE